jgi:hypothetical protein
MAAVGKPRRKAKKKKPFEPLTEHQLRILENWQSIYALPLKVVCVLDACGLSTAYERIHAGEYAAVKDGASTKILTESVKARRAASLKPYNAANAS